MSPGQGPDDDTPPNRYDAALAAVIESRWQQWWDEQGTYETPNPTGPLSTGFDKVAGLEKLFIMDMFPYPSGAGLHVGHPLGYLATDVWARYQRMRGHNVLHTMGFDAFGLPAEEYARQTGTHPRTTTETNIATMRRQLRRFGFGHDQRRSIATTDEGYFRWTQWIFLQLFESWYDGEADRARPVSELRELYESGGREVPGGRAWSELGEGERADVIDGERLARRENAPVNWCPALGTVLANEEVTAQGLSDRGNHPVYRRQLTQWVLQISAYAQRLLDDLDDLDWPDSIKLMQRNWIGRSEGASLLFEAGGHTLEVFTTRPDTVFGATYMVISPEHALIDELTAPAWPEGTDPRWTAGAATPAEAVAALRSAGGATAAAKRGGGGVVEGEGRGAFTGSYATNPATGARIPVFIADYVVADYGTGALMAVPAHDTRDRAFAQQWGLPVVSVVEAPEGHAGGAWTGPGALVNSGRFDGRPSDEGRREIVDWLAGRGAGSHRVTFRLRDWLFSRQRYWGEPIPVVYGDDGRPRAVPADQLPVQLPDVLDYAPRASDDPDAMPEAPLARVEDWVETTLDLGDGPRRYRRETNTMPQWAGSCWYYLRYLDPQNDTVLVDPEVERYWMHTAGPGGGGGVDLYVGGVEHAVLHLLYARFWHKVLFDLGHVSTPEPFQRLVNQGYIQAAAYVDERGQYVDSREVVEAGGTFLYEGRPVTRRYGKMGKSLKNSVTPDEIYDTYGADTLRLYEMAMGPISQGRPWEPKSIVGSYRLLQRVWRNLIDEDSGRPTVTDDAPDDETLRLLDETIRKVTGEMEALRFNTAISAITEFNNHLTKRDLPVGRSVVEPLVKMLAPFVPHVGQEIWQRLGYDDTIVYEPWPEPSGFVAEVATVERAVQVNGKVRGRIEVPVDAGEDEIRTAALADPGVQRTLGDRPAKRVIVTDRVISVVV